MKRGRKRKGQAFTAAECGALKFALAHAIVFLNGQLSHLEKRRQTMRPSEFAMTYSGLALEREALHGLWQRVKDYDGKD